MVTPLAIVRTTLYRLKPGEYMYERVVGAGKDADGLGDEARI